MVCFLTDTGHDGSDRGGGGMNCRTRRSPCRNPQGPHETVVLEFRFRRLGLRERVCFSVSPSRS